MTKERINLSDTQMAVAQKIVAWLETDEKYFAVSGYAGTGKTTIGRWLQEEIGGASFAAYTGKAVSVLQGKGCRDVATIHASIYQPKKRSSEPMIALKKELESAEASGNQMAISSLKKQIEMMEEELAKPSFALREEGVRPFKIIDEYSMVNQEMFSDLCLSYDKLLFFGDPFQLPPIGKTDRSREPAYCPVKPSEILTEIHRQAADSPILHAATHIRNLVKPVFCDWGDFRYKPRWEISDEELFSADKVIVGRNATRNQINKWFRERRGIHTPYPRAGEKMMCLQNDKDLGLFNGIEVEVYEDAIPHPTKDYAYLCKFKDVNLDMMGKPVAMECWLGELMGEKFMWSDKRLRGLKQFTFCDAITCHKSQGSEYENVFIYNEPIAVDDTGKMTAEEKAIMEAKWLYTAVTRGKKRVTLVQP